MLGLFAVSVERHVAGHALYERAREALAKLLNHERGNDAVNELGMSHC